MRRLGSFIFNAAMFFPTLFAVRVVLVPLTRLALFVPAAMLGAWPAERPKR